VSIWPPGLGVRRGAVISVLGWHVILARRCPTNMRWPRSARAFCGWALERVNGGAPYFAGATASTAGNQHPWRPRPRVTWR